MFLTLTTPSDVEDSFEGVYAKVDSAYAALRRARRDNNAPEDELKVRRVIYRMWQAVASDLRYEYEVWGHPANQLELLGACLNVLTRRLERFDAVTDEPRYKNLSIVQDTREWLIEFTTNYERAYKMALGRQK